MTDVSNVMQAVSLMIWQQRAAEIRDAYLDSESKTALVVASPDGGVNVAPLEFWAGGYTDSKSDYGPVTSAIEKCRRERVGSGPAAFFVVYIEGAGWKSNVMQFTFMNRGGSA